MVIIIQTLTAPIPSCCNWWFEYRRDTGGSSPNRREIVRNFSMHDRMRKNLRQWRCSQNLPGDPSGDTIEWIKLLNLRKVSIGAHVFYLSYLWKSLFGSRLSIVRSSVWSSTVSVTVLAWHPPLIEIVTPIEVIHKRGEGAKARRD